MRIQEEQGTIRFSLQPEDFRTSQWQQFIYEIKKIDGWHYDPIKRFWTLPITARQEFERLKTKYIKEKKKAQQHQMLLF